MTKAQELAAAVNKALGIDTIRMGNDPLFVTKYTPTGVLPIDLMLGGGLPRNRITEFYGGFSTLKSYIGYKAIAQCQAAGGTAVLVDTEHVFDESWASTLGVDVGQLIIPPTETAEEAMDVSEVMVRQGIDLLVWDSVAATLPQTEANKRLSKESVQPARQAAFMSLALRKLTAANKSTAVMFTNQTRINVGMTFGNPETTPGGKALPFYSSYRVKLARVGKVESTRTYYENGLAVKGKQVDMHKIKATLDKSKLNQGPGREYTFFFDLHSGTIDEVGFLVSAALELGAVKVSGHSWSISGSRQKPVKGREQFIEWVRKNPTAVEALTAQVMRLSFPGRSDLGSQKAGAPRRVLRVKKA